MGKLLLIVNPAAGVGRGKRAGEEIARLYEGHAWQCTPRSTEGAGDAARFAREEAAAHDLVLCVGGDGTLSETLGGLTQVENAPPLCYVPMGSTNDLALSAGLPRDPLTAAGVGLTGTPCAIDAGSFDGRVFSYVASFGAFTRTSYATDRALKNRIGHLAYIITAAQELGHITSYPVRVETPEETIEGDFLFGSLCNTRSIGGMLKLPVDKKDLRDGLHELLMLRKPARVTDLSTLIPSLLAGKFDHPLLVYRHVPHAIFHLPDELPWSLDGERADAGTRVEIRNLHNAYRLMLPESIG